MSASDEQPTTDPLEHGKRAAPPLADNPHANAGIWDEIAAKPEFGALLATKARFILPMCVFFLVYYFALPLLVGLAPDLMAKKVWGAVNVAYLFALSQFFMTWIVAIVYAKVAGRYDRLAHDLVGHHKS